MKEWQELLSRVLRDGEPRADRTGVGTKALFGVQFEVDNTLASFPAVTTKKLATGPCFAEMACFIQGYTNLKQFHEMGCHIWDANAAADYWQPQEQGDLGRIYGCQWRHWRSYGNHTTDQLRELVLGIRQSPTSRRHLVTAWNPGELHQMCLPPCHTMFQVYVSNDRHLDLLVTMRSVDLFLGLPFDVAGYALLQHLIALHCDLLPRKLKFSLGDAHIYNNHVEQVKLVCSRIPYAAPILSLARGTDLFSFRPEQAELLRYAHHGVVKAEMAV